MTDPSPEAPMLDAADVAAWLEANPDFLQHRPELLAALELRHQTEAGCSLIERQIGVLRGQLEDLRGKLDEYHASAEANESLFRRVHELYLELIASPSPEELAALLRARLSERFACDAVALGRVDGPPVPGIDDFRSRQEHFREALADGQPVCGRLSAQRLEALFGPSASARIRSTALVPWGLPPAGLLALGSEDERRFHPGMGTLFLSFLGQMFAQRLGALEATAASSAAALSEQGDDSPGNAASNSSGDG